MKTYLRLIRYLQTQWRNVVGAVACTIIIAISNVAIIPVVGELSRAIGSKNFLHLNVVIGVALGIYFFKSAASYGQGYLMSFAAQRVSTDLRIDLFRHLQDHSLDFFSEWRTGELISRATSDLQNVQAAMSATVMELLPSFLSLIGIMGYLFYLDWRLTLLTIVMAPLVIYAVLRFGEEMRHITGEAQKKIADIASLLQEKISGIREVKSFTMEKHEIQKFSEEAESSFWLSMKTYQIDATQKPVVSFLQAFGIVAVIWFGGYEVVTGKLEAAQLLSFFAGIGLLLDPVGSLSRANLLIQSALVGARRVFEIIDTRPTISEKPSAKELSQIRGEITFEQVSFNYNGQTRAALDKIDLTIDPGKIVALVGPSGAGKSTLINLLARFYDPTAGTIRVDGHDLRDVTFLSLRQQIGIVPQEPMLFSGTVLDNIAYGRMGSTHLEIEQAARAANASQFIDQLPQGYNTPIGERGVRLSGGERQRVAIARAVLRDPRILILDEATSQLDAESEKLIQEALHRLMQGRTTLVIAHRLSTVQRADQIVVLDRGRIVESGRHVELLGRNGLYKRLHDLQFQTPTAVVSS